MNMLHSSDTVIKHIEAVGLARCGRSKKSPDLWKRVENKFLKKGRAAVRMIKGDLKIGKNIALQPVIKCTYLHESFRKVEQKLLTCV